MNRSPARFCRQCGADFGVYRAPTTIYCSDCYSRLAPARRKKTGGDYACGQVTKAVKKGILPPAKDMLCVDCGKQATEYDHRDYNEPLKVEPVCHSCNMRRGPAIPSGSHTKGDRIEANRFFEDGRLELVCDLVGLNFEYAQEVVKKIRRV